jgi:hypothetical protein
MHKCHAEFGGVICVAILCFSVSRHLYCGFYITLSFDFLSF